MRRNPTRLPKNGRQLQIGASFSSFEDVWTPKSGIFFIVHSNLEKNMTASPSLISRKKKDSEAVSANK